MSPFNARLFHPLRLWRLGKAQVRLSLQTRTVASVIVVTLIVAVVLSMVSMASSQSSLLRQVSTQSRDDFFTQVEQAQRSLDSADTSASVQYQQLVNDLAATLQNEGSSNLVGVYMWSRDSTSRSIVPVSTDPTYTELISEDIRVDVSTDTEGNVYYQPVSLPRTDGRAVPGAVLGTVLQFAVVGDLEVFVIYSYDSQQSALEQIQNNLILVSILLSVIMGVLVWYVLHGIVRPVERVAAAAETLAAGDLDARVEVNRKDEIGTLQRSFNEMAVALNLKIDELEAASASQRRFVSDVSHELRTPVTTMRMASDLLESRKDTFDATTRRTVELLDGQIGRFQDMLADLLEISRYDAGYAALDLVETDVREVIGEAVDQVQGIADARGVAIVVDVPRVQVLARMDPRRIIRIIRNLVNNAIDFAEGHPIEVRLAANRKAVVISVRDRGVGMDAEQVAHVFDRFWRADPSRSRTTGGSGLGLSIASTDARLHQGTLTVRSKPGEGAWFLLSLPRDPDHGMVAPRDMPVAFVAQRDRMEVTGGFGLADNRAADYQDGYRTATAETGA